MRTLQEQVERMVAIAYTKGHLSRDLIAIFSNRTLMRISFTVLGVFLPIFFYTEFNYDLEVVFAIYIALYGICILLIPLGVRLLSRIGMRRMIMLGVSFAIVSLMALYLFPISPVYAALAYVMAEAIYRTLYWIPYHVDLANALDKSHRGRQLAILNNISNAVLVFAPLVGGIIITAFGFQFIFLFSIVVMLISMIPLWFLSNTYERYSWGYLETFMILFSRRNRSLFLAHAASGAQSAIILFFWPIFVFVLLDERLTVLGLITTLTIVVVIVLRLIIGELFDRWDRQRVVALGVVLATTGWLSKIFIQTPFQVLAADSYHRAGHTINRLSFDAMTYEQASDNGRYVDEYTALKDIADNTGRVLILLTIIALLSFFDMRVVFILAAFVALFMLALNERISL